MEQTFLKTIKLSSSNGNRTRPIRRKEETRKISKAEHSKEYPTWNEEIELKLADLKTEINLPKKWDENSVKGVN